MSQPPEPASPEPQYPGTATPPPEYPGTSAPPPSYPGAATPPQYPGAATPPPYPGAPAAPPPYPQATPAPPQYPTAPPAYPGAPPQHPGAAAPYPGPAPQYPAQAPQPAPFVPRPAVAPDDLDYRHQGSRVHVAAHQRGADATAIGQLATQIPGFLVSFAVVAAVAVPLFGSVVGWLVVLAWLASGALVFHRPTELLFARRVVKLRAPLAEERARLEPIWREVTARAGIEADTYELMVENSDDLNASAVAGHVVSVTTYSLNRIPSSNLAAVLAHELGHHTGGHAWAGLLGHWYSLPGRIAWALTRGLARIALAVASVFSLAATGILVLFMGMFVVFGFIVAWYITIPLVIAPYLLAYAGRLGELRADQQAAALGFATEMAQVLHHFQAEEDAAKAYAAAQGKRLKEPGGLAKLLTSHPDNYTRLRALEPYLQLPR
ncbi:MULTISPECIES: M48 family metalloprotease [unclassified Streptomyces]|uniref:M48 family metalloprotease n=1 Tax=unclassified Streptomyces TaxID=2593676 RepID=UPI002E818DC7|nr:M48 family metalloprotease [Streptomyces sp. NBC_00589]WTI36959.1 M48 family metalloprotease [Streptomyces sp. NBC_00775]WUB29365.1 M48 family metalloprotease [Streptomyces sp. NBC_00589]